MNNHKKQGADQQGGAQRRQQAHDNPLNGLRNPGLSSAQSSQPAQPGQAAGAFGVHPRFQQQAGVPSQQLGQFANSPSFPQAGFSQGQQAPQAGFAPAGVPGYAQSNQPFNPGAQPAFTPGAQPAGMSALQNSFAGLRPGSQPFPQQAPQPGFMPGAQPAGMSALQNSFASLRPGSQPFPQQAPQAGFMPQGLEQPRINDVPTPSQQGLALLGKQPDKPGSQGFTRRNSGSIEGAPVFLTFAPGVYVATYVKRDNLPQTVDGLSYPMASIMPLEVAEGGLVSFLNSEGGCGWFKQEGEALAFKVEGGKADIVLTTYKPQGYGPSGMHIEISRLDKFM